jgi:hypothetical protein
LRVRGEPGSIREIIATEEIEVKIMTPRCMKRRRLVLFLKVEIATIPPSIIKVNVVRKDPVGVKLLVCI